MISMQRSLSSPINVQSSLPPSPPVQSPPAASKSPTPSPSESHVDTLHSQTHRTKSPSRAAKDANMSRRSDDLSRRGPGLQMPTTLPSRPMPTIEQDVEPSPAPTPKDSSDSLNTNIATLSLSDGNPAKLKFPRPLLSDVSLYTQPFWSPESEGTTLEELAHVVRLSKYQERKRANTRIRLQRNLISTALSARLMRSGEMAHRSLVDCFRGDDKKTFASLYNAIIDVRKSCDETRRYAMLEPDMELAQAPGLTSTESVDTPTGSVAGATPAPGSVPCFLNELSAESRETLLNVLNQIRTNPDYLATRICSLKSTELAALTKFHQTMEPIESVLPYHSRPAGRGTSAMSGSSSAVGSTFSSSSSAVGANRQSAQERSAIERLLSFQRHDPMSALVYTCFANSAGPDSAEDQRRTAIWANVCARLISNPATGSEQTVMSICNVWVSMRGWSGKSNMEWYLMKILEEGAFLLDRAEDQHGTRFNISDWSSKDQIAAEEFYAKAVDELFEVIDDEDNTGIPEGLIELGNEIQKCLEKKYLEATRKWLVAKFLFSTWLLGVIIHPEAYGMMSDYHITEYGRQKILKSVAMNAQKLVIDMLHSKTPVSIPPKIRGHIESIQNRFRTTKYQPKTRLLPARSITSLRETAEVHPYLVVSPADLATIANALFPDRRPASVHSGGRRSGAPSVSNFSVVSQPMSVRTAPSTQFDAQSIVSTSAESIMSDITTSREPLLEEGTGYSPPASSAPSSSVNYEDDGYRLRLALHEMSQVLGQDVLNGSCHPCAERWAVLFISGNGSQLSTHMTFDPDDEVDEEATSSNTDSETDETDNERPTLYKDYHQLRDAILKLVQEYEIPQNLENSGTRKQTFSNRASTLKKYRSKNRIVNSMGSRNPYNSYRSRAPSVTSSLSDTSSRGNGKGKEVPEAAESAASPLIAMLTAASSQSRAQSDFVNAHLYWRTLQQLNALTSDSLRKDGFATLLNIFSRGPRDSIRKSAAAIEDYDAWLIWLKQSQERAEGLIDSMMRRLRALRDKMWYVTDVRNSAPYDESRNVAVALKTMGMPHRWNSFQRVKSRMQRGPASSYLFKTESQILDILAAPEEQGGPNKLRDEQAEKTARWLQQYEVENFCCGEERIHRFCCEVDNCINKLLGDSIVDGPVLWSSELFTRDRRNLESKQVSRRDQRDFDTQSVSWDDSISVISDPERRFNTPGMRGRSSNNNLRALSGHNLSQLSFDSSSRFSYSRASTAISEIDGSDYFGASSPVHQIDSRETFWSPFHHRPTSPSTVTSRAQSPTTSVTNFSGSFNPPNHHALPSNSQHSIGRSGASVTSSNETVFQQRQSEEKARFLGELRQTLTSLILSDLGNLVFSRGSETDAWFEGLGQDCIDRREAIQRRNREALGKEKRKSAGSKGGLKQRVLERKRSYTDLRDGVSEKGASETQSPVAEAGGSGSVHGNENTAPETTGQRSNRDGKKEVLPDFPFMKSYQRLLRMFCVHPNPYVKLNALHELQHLISASLSSGSRRSRLAWARSDLGSASSATEEHGVQTRSQPIDDAIDSFKERRSHALMQAPTFAGSHGHGGRGPAGGRDADARSVVSVYPANTDAIANVLQKLFRDAGMRPKTLFRDLQFIAAFVSPNMLDKTERGKAFWDAGLAALSLKQEVCRTMVEVADEVVKNFTTTRNDAYDHRTGEEPSGTQTPTADNPSSPFNSPPSPLPLTTHSLADAARMWTITAKEGDPTAQRELAIFYLSNPELVERTTLPLSKPREVFKQAVIDKYGSGGGGGGGGGGHGHGHGRSGHPGGSSSDEGSRFAGMGMGDVRSDPALMCLAIHWMGAAESGGDELAKTFMAQQMR
ncbi:hypothetical protein B0T20DRAFT_449623 [Sordaria brevicollis]|uniref:Uncharacterized protein n=1 Tax=Sordaria brevicollis TaxID=83679 RepID=A0AAE0PMM7_SORBR|nr:hypothetical protein B0T20DRAFT_449623 [Sordaria brevicollis]